MSNYPQKTCDYCQAVGVMATFMNGITCCNACLKILPMTTGECWGLIASLRQQLEEAQARNDFIDEAAARVPMDTLLIARAELAEVECKARDAIISDLERRLADAEAQEGFCFITKESSEEIVSKASTFVPIFAARNNVLPNSIALYLRPIPPATDERVKELERALLDIRKECADDETLGYHGYVIMRADAALAASKGEKP